MFQIGNRVVRRAYAEEVGTVSNVLNVRTSPEFTVYEVEFPSGRQTLRGLELRALYPSCKEWRRLSRVSQTASSIYFRVVSELSRAAGLVAHTEFELLRRRVESAREICRVANERLKEHSEKHGC